MPPGFAEWVVIAVFLRLVHFPIVDRVERASRLCPVVRCAGMPTLRITPSCKSPPTHSPLSWSVVSVFGGACGIGHQPGLIWSVSVVLTETHLLDNVDSQDAGVCLLPLGHASGVQVSPR